MTVQPSSNWGGPRQGRPGAGYVNRTDLMQGPRTTGSPAAQAQPSTAEAAWVPPDAVPNLGDPSSDERPLTDGLPVGPGAGPEALAPAPDTVPDRTLLTLQALYRATDSDHIRRLIQRRAVMTGRPL